MSEHPLPATAAGDDWLDRALREDGQQHRAEYLGDDGFTARVMALLPAPVVLPAWRKPVVFALWTIAAAGAVWALPGASTEVAREFLRLVGLVGGYPVSLAQIATGVAALAGGSWAMTAYALSRD